jgi:large subunit ribosomal protein L6
MSRIGREAITVPAGVTVKIDGQHVYVKGPKGELEMDVHPSMTVSMDNGIIHITRPDDEPFTRSLHGLTRSLVNNMVVGVTQEFSKELQINGVGYRAQKTGKQLIMNLGYSHQVTVDEIPGITIDVPDANRVIIHGPDKQKVGQFAADVRKKRPPEPYKGKGIKYVEETIRRKEGKTGKK